MLEYPEEFYCPYCSQPNALVIDISGGPLQQFVVDCEVCCAPIVIRARLSHGQVTALDVRRENE